MDRMITIQAGPVREDHRDGHYRGEVGAASGRRPRRSSISSAVFVGWGSTIIGPPSALAS